MLMKMGLSFQEGGAYKILILGNYVYYDQNYYKTHFILQKFESILF